MIKIVNLLGTGEKQQVCKLLPCNFKKEKKKQITKNKIIYLP